MMDFMKEKPIFFMMVGLPYSGKSAYAKKLQEQFGAEIHSSDAIRAELLGDVQDQTNNQEVFNTLHRRVIADLSSGKNVIYDATNINYKRRLDMVSRLKKLNCQKVCIFMATPFEECLARVQTRTRVVPYEIVERMYKHIWIPFWYEGWDYIELVYPDGFQPYSISDLFNNKDSGLNYFQQDNPHHNFTVGHHCIAAYGLVSDGSAELQEAALLHDIGKPFTKTFVNSKGETTEIAHYYEHQHVSAYDSLFYSNPDLDRLYIANVIQWHMYPFDLERNKNSSKAKKRFRQRVGERVYADVMKLHEADIKAKGAY